MSKQVIKTLEIQIVCDESVNDAKLESCIRSAVDCALFSIGDDDNAEVGGSVQSVWEPTVTSEREYEWSE